VILQQNQQCSSQFQWGKINKVCQSNDNFQSSLKTVADEKNILLQSVLWFYLTSGIPAFLIMDFRTEKALTLCNLQTLHYHIIILRISCIRAAEELASPSSVLSSQQKQKGNSVILNLLCITSKTECCNTRETCGKDNYIT